MIFKGGFLLLAAVLSTTALGESGTIALTGHGSAASAPQYVSYSVAVTSICYNTSQEASAANAKAANAVLAVLDGFKKDSLDKVTATGGANVLRTETTQNGRESRVLCEMKWHVENHLEIQMARFADLPDLQDKLITALSGGGGIDEGTATQTYAEVGQPEFRLYPETSRQLRDIAQGLAFDDAKSQLRVLQSRCSFVDLKLVSLSAPDYSFAYKLAGERYFEGISATPIIPDEMEIAASIQTQWAFTPTPACEF